MVATDTELADDLRQVAETIQATPIKEDYRKHGNHTVHTLKERFGSWSEARAAAGLPDSPGVDQTQRQHLYALHKDLESSQRVRADGGDA